MNIELLLSKAREYPVYDLALMVVIWMAILTGVLVCMISAPTTKDEVPVFTKVDKLETVTVEPIVLPAPAPVTETVPTQEPKQETTQKQKFSATNSEIDLLALVTMAEAEGESELGKRLVIDTILNRVDSKRFTGDTIHDVVYAKNQFEAMWNGRVNKCYVRDDIRKLVIEELENRTNTEVLYFRTGHYTQFGKPLFKEGNHYFSTTK